MGAKQGKTTQQKPQQLESSNFYFNEMVKKNCTSKVQNQYEILKKIGSGITRAIKKISKNTNPNIHRIITNQFEILREMDHPNIMKMFEFFEDAKYFYIVSELVKGKQLYEIFQEKKKFNEKESFSIFYNALLAISYLHKNKVMHRDIKLENMIYDQKSKCLKIIDFGNALVFDDDKPRERNCTGTASYIAPEVIAKVYNSKCDIWSLGIFLYVLLSGNAPFVGENNEDVMKKIVNEEVTFNKPAWEKISPEVKSLLSKLLQKKIEKRIQVDDIFQDPWIQKNKDSQQISNEDQEYVFEAFKNMKKFSKIKVAEIQIGVLVFMINFVIAIENEDKMERCYHYLDYQGDGVIDEKELVQAMTEYLDEPQAKAKQTAKEIMMKIDFNNSKDINYSQFVAAAVDLKKVLTQDNLMKTFRYIDTDNNGKLSVQEIKAQLGENIQDFYYQKMLKFFDEDKDGEISDKQFVKMMKTILNNY